ncbi:DNA polymerase iota isoform X1 [Podarcis raffonei]|uniref:DNA polymerase iota isoform X1 n=2 Tax=Podarcis raffonei TaxID=65483 RepID=UPI0023294AAE|nr:DNA polymerase iota isoform X1 [Podarcis raffonei]
MEGSGDDEEPDWLLPEPAGSPGRDPLAAGGRVPSCHGKVASAGSSQHRIIVHLDLDCFYAQVEMICNPELRSKPLGVQQKYLMVTCNYEARNAGVKKCMSVKEAKEKCPELVLVNGEDLTKYREMSYKFTALLEEFTPLVERLGLDENFVDITEMVEKRLGQWKKDAFSQISLSGHVYNNQTVDLHDPVHIRLAVGSQVAAELRAAMHSRLGLTGCAGVATNKLLSKLVSGTFKPNQQTVLLPEGRQDLMNSLDNVMKVPGIGYKTAKRLATLGITTVRDLQTCPTAILERELGSSVAQHIQKLSWGEDDSPVNPSGLPQSLSDEDSFRKCSSEAEVKKKIEELLTSLLDRLYKDGRKPHTIRLTIRQFSPTNKWFNRESRQCPIPSHVVQRIGTGDSKVKTHLVALLMKLFHKMINVQVPFHLTLLNVCFSSLKAPPASAKQTIGFYLTRSPPSSSCSKVIHETEGMGAGRITSGDKLDCCEASSEVRGAIKGRLESPDLLKDTGLLEFPLHLFPDGIDCNVFNQLPADIKEEIISSQMRGDSTASLQERTLWVPREGIPAKAQDQTSHASLISGSIQQDISSLACGGMASTNDKPPLAVNTCTHSCLLETGENASIADATVCVKSSPPVPSQPSFLQLCIPEGQKHPDKEASNEGWKDGSKLVLPPNIDPQTFSELPTEMQKELLVEWKSQELASKLPAGKTQNRLKREKKGLPSAPHSNSLLRYFKPK